MSTTQEPVSSQRTAAASLMMEQIFGFIRTKIITVAAELRLADHLADGPRTVAELAAVTGMHAASLYRVLRALAGIGIFIESAPGQFMLNEAAETLRSDSPTSLRGTAIYLGRWSYRGWNHAMHSVETGEAGFPTEFGTTVWDYQAANPEAAQFFNQMMQSGAMMRTLALRAYPWAGHEAVVDLGGSNGALLIELLGHHRGLTGTVADLPHVVAEAEVRIRESDLTDRCRARVVDLFGEVPEGGDVYTLVTVLHDWDDEHATQILQNCRRAMAPHARLLVVEMVLPEAPGPGFGRLVDLLMLVENGGRERTRADWEHLFETAQLQLATVYPGEPWSVIEARPV